jgi:hypothetical protein
VPTSSAAARQTWISREPRLSPQTDRTGLQPGHHSVLVVDDDRGVLGLIARMLRLEGYTVLEAGSGSEALRLLEAEPEIRLVVTDVLMPGMHGLDLAEQIGQREQRPRVILMTDTRRSCRPSWRSAIPPSRCCSSLSPPNSSSRPCAPRWRTSDTDRGCQRMRLPNTDWTSSTANVAVALRTSRMGLASTTSSEVMIPESASTSMSRCASR